jgi:hypothetical protein
MSSEFGDADFAHWTMKSPEKFKDLTLGTIEHGTFQVRTLLDGLFGLEGSLL